MAHFIGCDYCGTQLQVNASGEDEEGEVAGWIGVHAGPRLFDVCTRACAVALIDNPEGDVAQILESYQEIITGLVKDIKSGLEED